MKGKRLFAVVAAGALMLPGIPAAAVWGEELLGDGGIENSGEAFAYEEQSAEEAFTLITGEDGTGDTLALFADENKADEKAASDPIFDTDVYTAVGQEASEDLLSGDAEAKEGDEELLSDDADEAGAASNDLKDDGVRILTADGMVYDGYEFIGSEISDTEIVLYASDLAYDALYLGSLEEYEAGDQKTLVQGLLNESGYLEYRFSYEERGEFPVVLLNQETGAYTTEPLVLFIPDEEDAPAVSAATGNCGDHLNFSYNSSTKVLTISGYGPMRDFSSGDSPWNGYRKNITKVVITGSPTTIGKNAFWYCTKMTSINIPSTVTSIGGNAFSNCGSLKTITIPSGVTSIGGRAFDSCESLTSASLPNTVSSMGATVFYNCRGLKTVNIPTSISKIPAWTFASCHSLKSIVIPSTIKEIDSHAFEGSGLTSINIPYGVTRIGYSSFNNCGSLKTVTIPESVKTIEDWAFVGCKSLTEITIPYSVTTVNAFGGCSALKTVRLKNNTAPISSNAFTGCHNITDVYFYGTLSDWKNLRKGSGNGPLINANLHFYNPMYRLFNPNSGEHLYTGNTGERQSLIGRGWKNEGIGWYAPESGAVVVYRLYNPKKGFEEHHYTADQKEIRALKNQGWKLEGPAWASDNAKGVPVYRLFNKAARNSASSHHYTTDINEKNVLVSRGWRYEGIAWYGCK